MFLSIIFQQSTDKKIHAFPLAIQCKKRLFTSKCRNDNKALIEASVFFKFFLLLVFESGGQCDVFVLSQAEI